MDVRRRVDRSISPEIAAWRPLVAPGRLIKLIDQNLAVYIFLRFERERARARAIAISILFVAAAYRSGCAYYLCEPVTVGRIRI